MSATGWQFWIDRGGTFTDCLGIAPDGRFHPVKVLSSDRAPIEAIETVLARAAESAGEATAPALESLVARVRLGTTVATNALLERRGLPTALVTPRGLSGVFRIGTQERPELFALEIRRPAPLPRWWIEVPGRRDATGVLVEPLDLEAARAGLQCAHDEGAEAVAIAWMHAHVEPEDELRLAALARELGFRHVVGSHELAREIGFLARGETAIADAYLTPLLRGHLADLRARLPRAEIALMQSSGGLVDLARFRGPHALLSGPAGGVVGAQRVARMAGHERAIGFDMGGTSTDVCLIEGERLDRVFESEVGGVRVKAPMLRIHTVAAGGGSLCRFDGIRLTVGPESAGSQPGPICYVRRDEGGEPLARELTLTDVNLALGRLAPDRFPFALDRERVREALAAMAAQLREAGFEREPDELAAGFFEIANASMAQAIAEVSVARGADPRDHVLVGFGGAGGQHVCALARRLGIREILLHPYAGLLSAWGIGLAETGWDGVRDGLGRVLPRAGSLPTAWVEQWRALEAEGRAALAAEGIAEEAIGIERGLDLRHAGTETALPVVEPGPAADAAAWQVAFEDAHRDRFGYVRAGREVELRALRLRAFGRMPEPPRPTWISSAPRAGGPEEGPQPLRRDEAWLPGVGRAPVPVFEREAFAVGDRLVGPALILEATGTVVVDPGFELEVDAQGVFHLRETDRAPAAQAVDLTQADPVRLEVLGNRFMSIAEQMGAVLRNTAVSTNIKERLDYSCAVFDGAGGLVANAPHIPVHLGAMADTVAALRRRFEPFAPGDVYVTNDPFEGGSHLPDVTVVAPVFLPGRTRPSFFVASRGHHADLGGKTPGSMPADSRSLAEEGVLIEPFALVRQGVFDEARIRRLLADGPHPARRPDDNVADLEAMVAATRAGDRLLAAVVEEVGEDVVQTTMEQLQRAAATKVARELARLEPGEHRFVDALDDGTPIVVTLRIDHAAAVRPGREVDARAVARDDALPARMQIDFSGSGPASAGNLNAPPAVVRAAVIYVLRSLVAERIPLNGGCLDPVEIRIPPGSILDPPRGAAVVGGNVETSQRVVDVLLGALGRAAASQGTMNNVTFGDESFGYYETIGGGAGATPTAAGASGVHSHMTNTRITDPELLEARFPVRLLEFGLRAGSGGAGRWSGGEGLVRRYLFLRPVIISLLSERRLRAPFGLAGGGSGAPGRNRIRRAAAFEPEELPGCTTLRLRAGDSLWIETPGGGGYGAKR